MSGVVFTRGTSSDVFFKQLSIQKLTFLSGYIHEVRMAPSFLPSWRLPVHCLGKVQLSIIILLKLFCRKWTSTCLMQEAVWSLPCLRYRMTRFRRASGMTVKYMFFSTCIMCLTLVQLIISLNQPVLPSIKEGKTCIAPSPFLKTTKLWRIKSLA